MDKIKHFYGVDNAFRINYTRLFFLRNFSKPLKPFTRLAQYLYEKYNGIGCESTKIAKSIRPSGKFISEKQRSERVRNWHD